MLLLFFFMVVFVVHFINACLYIHIYIYIAGQTESCVHCGDSSLTSLINTFFISTRLSNCCYYPLVQDLTIFGTLSIYLIDSYFLFRQLLYMWHYVLFKLIIQFVGTVNGLICITRFIPNSIDHFIVFNPLTKAFVEFMNIDNDIIYGKNNDLF